MTVPAELVVGDLLAPHDDAARAAHLRDEGLGDVSGLTWVLDRADELIHHDPGVADDLCRLCDLVACDQVDHDGVVDGEYVAVRARACYLRARVRTERGDLEAGLTLVAQARSLWQRAGRHTEALRTDLGKMSVLDDLGRHQDAIAVGNALLVAVDAIPGGSADHELGRRIRATAQENLGAAYGLTGQHERALEAYAQAEAGYRALGLVADTARPLGNRGIELLALSRPREAMADLRQAITLLEADGDRMYAAFCEGYLAQAHQQLGELNQALTVFERARATLAGLGAQAESDWVLLGLAETYLGVGLLAEARHAAGLAAERTTRAGTLHDTGVAHFVAGQAALGQGDLAAARWSLERAAQVFDQVGDAHYGARTRLARAEAVLAGGDRVEATRLLEVAAQALEDGGWLLPLANARLRQLDLARPVDADARLADVAQLVDQLKIPTLTQRYRLRLARHHRAAGRVDDAEEVLEAVVADLGQASDALTDHALRTAYRADTTAAPDELVDLLVERAGPGDLARARAVSDAAKAQTLRDLVADSVGSGPSLTSTDSGLAPAHAELGAAYLALQDAGTPRRRAELRAEVDRLEQQLALLRLQDAAQREAGPAGRRGAAAPIATGADVLEFHVLGDDVVVFVTVGQALSVRRLRGIVPDLQSGLEQLAVQWSRMTLGSSFAERHVGLLARTTNQLLTHLYDVLIAPVADLLGDGPGQRLHLVPHGVVGQLPLQALLDGTTALLSRFVLTISPTRVVDEPGADVSAFLTRPLVIGTSDAAAPSSELEAVEVAAMLPHATLLVGERASSADVMAALPGTSLLHLACHGLYRAQNPLFSRLRLADRWVTGAEILRLDLDGALVVLSACESGQHGQAPEPVGLGWAFLAAGASGVVASQWVVHDATTRTLMTRLYQGLTAGLDPASALQRAQLAVAAEHPHPFFWAPFTYLAAPASPRGDRHATS